MAMATQRSKALYNFTMPEPLHWGNHRSLQVNSDGRIATVSSDDRRQIRPHRTSVGETDRKTLFDESVHRSTKLSRYPPPESFDGRKSIAEDDGIAAMREKVMLDLQSAVDKMKNAIFKDGYAEQKPSIHPPLPVPPPHAARSGEGETCHPWNLRSRRTAPKISVSETVSDLNEGSTAGIGRKVLRTAISKADVRAKFSVCLTKREIEEDFFGMVRRRPPRRPKKRAKIVQRGLDALFPGLYLSEVTVDMYKVEETATPS